MSKYIFTDMDVCVYTVGGPLFPFKPLNQEEQKVKNLGYMIFLSLVHDVISMCMSTVSLQS